MNDQVVEVLVVKEKQHVQLAKEFVINNQFELDNAGLFLRGIKTLQKEIKDTFTPMKEKAHAVHVEICSKEKLHYAPVEEAEKIIKQKIQTYLAEQQKIENEKRRLLELEMKKQQEEIALKLAEQTKDEVKQEQILQQAINTKPVVQVEQTVFKPQGISTTKRWRFEIMDKTKINAQFLIPNETAISSLVTSSGMDAEKLIGGIRVWQEETINAKRF